MKIGIINSGGTISCVGTPLRPMTAKAFANACGAILDPIVKSEFPEIKLHYVTDLEFMESRSRTLDSTNLQPTDWCLMARYILENYDEHDGWVILHGTDSMDFTGSALPFLLSRANSHGAVLATLNKPVIITGSQVPMFHKKPAPHAQGEDVEPDPDPLPKTNLMLNYDTDAYQNFCGAVAAARTGIPEVCVYFQSHLYRGNRVLKTNASEFNAFSSPNYPALAEYGVEFTIHPENVLPGPICDGVSLGNRETRAATLDMVAKIEADIDKFPVIQLSAFPAWYNEKNSTALLADIIDACVAQGIKGLVLESYGEGNYPSGNPDTPSEGAIYRSLKKANDSGVVIVDCTQVIAGIVNNSAYASGAWLPGVGALNPSDMTPMAAFAKLMILLASAEHEGWNADDVKRLIQLNLQGEIQNVSRLDCRSNCELLPGQSISALDGSAELINDQVRGPLLLGYEVPESGPKKGIRQPITLWEPLSPEPAGMPGRLTMQHDGNLVYYNNYSKAVWTSDTCETSQLVIGGSYKCKDLKLYLYDYHTFEIRQVLYSQA